MKTFLFTLLFSTLTFASNSPMYINGGAVQVDSDTDGSNALRSHLALVGGNPCQNPSVTLVSTSGATSGTSATQIIALSGTKSIYICSLYVLGVSGTTPTFSLVYGTGSNCATGQATLMTSFGTVAAQFYGFTHLPAVAPSGQSVCYLDGGTTPVQDYWISYVQQ